MLGPEHIPSPSVWFWFVFGNLWVPCHLHHPVVYIWMVSNFALFIWAEAPPSLMRGALVNSKLV